MKKPGALVLDLDGTLYRKNMTIQLVKALFRAGHLDADKYVGFREQAHAWRNRSGSFHEYSAELVRLIHEGMLSKIEFEIIKTLSAEIVEKAWRHASVFIRELMLAAKEQKYLILAISGSPDFLVEPFCRRWEMDGWLASEFSFIENGRYLAPGWDHPDQPVRDKGRFLQVLLAKHGFSSPSAVPFLVTVGDSLADLPMLRHATHPIAFNAHKKFRHEALRYNLALVTEVRDVLFLQRASTRLNKHPTETNRIPRAQTVALHHILPMPLAHELKKRLTALDYDF